MRAVALIALAAACGGSSGPRREPEARAQPAGPPCLADEVPQPLPAQEKAIVCAGAEVSCRDWCEHGRAAACLSLGYLVEPDEMARREAFDFFRRACAGGLLIACTNHGAYLLNGGDGIEADPACAARLHELACDGGDAWGCGMFGFELVDGVGVPADLPRARKVLETSCEELGSFACRILGELLEQGRFGEVYRAAAPAAYARACQTGDVEACAEAERLAPAP